MPPIVPRKVVCQRKARKKPGRPKQRPSPDNQCRWCGALRQIDVRPPNFPTVCCARRFQEEYL